MSLGEAIISSIIIIVAAIVIMSSASTVSVTNDVKVPEVKIVWQQRLVHNAINNPYVALSDQETETDPDKMLLEQAGFVPYTPPTPQNRAPEEEAAEKPVTTTVTEPAITEPVIKEEYPEDAETIEQSVTDEESIEQEESYEGSDVSESVEAPQTSEE